MTSRDPIQKLALIYLENPTDENFNNLHQRVTPGLRNHIWYYIYITKDRDLLDELVQRTWIKVITKKHQYDEGRGEFSTWVFTIGKNEALQEYNKNKILVSLDFLFENEDDESESTDVMSLTSVINKENYGVQFNDLCEESEKQKRLKDLKIIILYEMKKLPTIYSDIIVDNLIWKKKYHELGDKYNITMNTVKSRIRTGKILLTERLKERSIDISNFLT